jgi:hypothetical protein
MVAARMSTRRAAALQQQQQQQLVVMHRAAVACTAAMDTGMGTGRMHAALLAIMGMRVQVEAAAAPHEGSLHHLGCCIRPCQNSRALQAAAAAAAALHQALDGQQCRQLPALLLLIPLHMLLATARV